MAQLIRPCIIVGLYALLLPVFGPLLDHHFAEWQHNHAHVYFNGGAPGHRHVYDAAAGGHAHRLLSDGTGAAGATGIAYLTAYDGAGPGSTYLPVTPVIQSLCFPDPGDCILLSGNAPNDIIPPGAFTAPPRKPPRA